MTAQPRQLFSSSVSQQGNYDLVKQTAPKIIPEIPGSDGIFLLTLAGKRRCCLIDTFLHICSTVSVAAYNACHCHLIQSLLNKDFLSLFYLLDTELRAGNAAVSIAKWT